MRKLLVIMSLLLSSCGYRTPLEEAMKDIGVRHGWTILGQFEQGDWDFYSGVWIIHIDNMIINKTQQDWICNEQYKDLRVMKEKIQQEYFKGSRYSLNQMEGNLNLEQSFIDSDTFCYKKIGVLGDWDYYLKAGNLMYIERHISADYNTLSIEPRYLEFVKPDESQNIK